jgi:hypothetical protein
MIKSLAVLSMLLASVAQAHLNDPNVPPCFEMRNEQVVALADTSAENVIEFSTPEFAPVNHSAFAAGDRLNLSVLVTGKLCSPYMVYILAESTRGPGLVQMTSPSPVYPPSTISRKVEHFITFAIDEKDVRPGAEVTVIKLRLSVQQYGSYKQLASYEIPLKATWRAPRNVSVAGIPEYECADDMNVPAALPQVEAPRCSSSIRGPDGGLRLDLNGDGICEWAAPDARCDKIFGNKCFRVYEEHDGQLRAVAQFYTELRIPNDGAAYRALSSVETGPKTNITHFSDWLDGRYVHHKYVQDCKLVP